MIIFDKVKRSTTSGGREDNRVYIRASHCPGSADKSTLCETVDKKGWAARETFQ